MFFSEFLCDTKSETSVLRHTLSGPVCGKIRLLGNNVEIHSQNVEMKNELQHNLPVTLVFCCSFFLKKIIMNVYAVILFFEVELRASERDQRSCL